MTKLLLILQVLLYAAGVKASCFLGFSFGCSKSAAETVIESSRPIEVAESRLGIDVVLEQKSLPMSPAAAALLKSLKDDEFGPKEFREFFYDSFIGFIRIFDTYDSFFQDYVVISAFGKFANESSNSEAVKSLIQNYVLPAYPLLEEADFDYEYFLAYLDSFKGNNDISKFMAERVYLVFKKRFNRIMDVDDADQSQIQSDLLSLFNKVQKSMYSDDVMVTHSFCVIKYAPVDNISKANKNCARSVTLKDYMICLADSFNGQMVDFIKLKHYYMNLRYMENLIYAICSSAAMNGVSEIISLIIKLSSEYETNIIWNRVLAKCLFCFACNNEQTSIMEIIIDAEPSIRIASNIGCKPLLLATKMRNDKLFYHLLDRSNADNKTRDIWSDITDSIDLAIKNNNLEYCEAILKEFDVLILNDLAKWMADAMDSKNEPLKEILMNNSSRYLRELTFAEFKEAVQSRDSEKVRTLWNERQA